MTEVSGFQYCARQAGDCFWPTWIRRHLPNLLCPGGWGAGDGAGSLLAASLEMILQFPPPQCVCRRVNFHAQGSGEAMCYILWFWTHFLGRESSISDRSVLVILRRKECAFLCGFLWAPETINVFIFKCQP